MNRSKASLLAWTLFAIITVIALFSMAADLANRPADDNLFKVIGVLLYDLLAVEFALLAALIVARQPHNVIGWLMMGPAAMLVMDFLATSYLEQFPTAPAAPTLPLLLAVYFSNVGWLLLIFPLFFIMLLFPDGLLPSPRWRWVLGAGLGMCAFLIFFALFSPAFTPPQNDNWVVANPIGFLPADLAFPDTAWFVALIALTLSCAAAPFARYRRAAGVERQQIKWLFYACSLFALIYVPDGLDLGGTNTILEDILGLLFVLGIMAIPAAIAIAITRYRLYDIDVIIRKTLIYAVLTGLLALVYLGTVVLLQSLFEQIIFDSTSGQQSALSIVISTLIIAALFAPLRRRVQIVIDRRFFRQKYDAQLVLAEFAQTARDEVELAALTAELARVAQETVQPESVSIWLREDLP